MAVAAVTYYVYRHVRLFYIYSKTSFSIEPSPYLLVCSWFESVSYFCWCFGFDSNAPRVAWSTLNPVKAQTLPVLSSAWSIVEQLNAFACAGRLAEAKPERETDTVIELNNRLGERLRRIRSIQKEEIFAVVCFNISDNPAGRICAGAHSSVHIMQLCHLLLKHACP